MKSTSMYSALVAVCVAALIFTVGCATTGKPGASKTCSMCPTCKMATSQVAVKDASCTKIACPCCGKVTPVNGPLADALRNYMGDTLPATVPVCAHCKCAMAPCAECLKGKKK